MKKNSTLQASRNVKPTKKPCNTQLEDNCPDCPFKKANTEKVGDPYPDHKNSRKDLLACIFYGLASIYYGIQLLGVVLAHINMPVNLHLADIFNTKIVEIAMQAFTITLVMFKNKMK
jgi:hypothetical protein